MFGAVDWPVLFGFDRALLEIFVRGTVMSLSLLILLRVTPSHETGDASPTGLLSSNLRQALMSRDDLQSKLRQHGVQHVEQVQEAWLEPDGEISVITGRSTA